jgi:hypothetical protein
MKVQRNDPCPCGSGSKYKRCCGATDEQSEERGGGFLVAVTWAVGAGLVVALAVFANALVSDAPAEAGRVWSAEHGHWHNVGGGEVEPATAPGPDGPAPPGATWSDEHGHWHGPDGKALAGAGSPAGSGSASGGPGKVWSEEHGHWHDAAPLADNLERRTLNATPLENRLLREASRATEAAD